eukprot:maker-scaffold289_size220122-snap-gene-1.24 protein:Tk01619 transcript:maker-scaffold289_size220122-snap-gene-1.24-mRNA-1 annotation:"leucine-rich repeat-containing protein 28"
MGDEEVFQESVEDESSLRREIESSTILHWNYRNLSSLPRELLESGPHVKEVYLKENRITHLPQDLGSKLIRLTNLYLFGNRLHAFPTALLNLPLLQVLDLSHNGMDHLPAAIGQIRTLRTLDLSQNRLSDLPAELGNLVHLEYLVAAQNRLTRLPSTLGQLTALVSLQVGGNLLKALPAEIHHCRRLTDLGCENNGIHYLPSGLTRLPSLARINVSHNQLRHLPAWPFMADTRITFDFNPALAHVPFHLGCHQTRWSGWSAPPLPGGALGPISWTFRHRGCFESYERPRGGLSPGRLIRTRRAGRTLYLDVPWPDCTLVQAIGRGPGGSMQFRFAHQTVPSLGELAVRQVHHWTQPEQWVKRVDPISGLHTVTAGPATAGRRDWGGLPPAVTGRLAEGPRALCVRPECPYVLFDSGLLVICPVAWRSDRPAGAADDEPEEPEEPALASLSFCSSTCLTRYALSDHALARQLDRAKYTEWD